MYDLECENLTKLFGRHRAVNDVSFEVPRGSFFSILGPSGCGKTTLMRMIAGFETPANGDIYIKGKSVLATPPNKRSVKMVFQHLALFPMMNVGENIAYGLHCQGESKAEIGRKVTAVLDRVGLPGVAEKQIAQLSGGQKQRIAIARCMVLEPDVLLLDEPLGALDLKLRERMKIELKLLQSQFNTTFLYITHDQSEALIMSDNVAVMNAGRFEQIGSPEQLYNNPKTGFVAGFVGDSNRWLGRVVDVAGKAARIDLEHGGQIVATLNDDAVAAGMQVEVFVRPETISLRSDNHEGNRLSGVVDSLLFNGANSRVLVRTGHGDLVEVSLAVMDGSSPIRPGDAVDMVWQREHCLCFALAGWNDASF
ncbi:ABC transporter ATP-binding protein [Aquamicrobium segne]|uniref:ABC transporter ATP-binding protein n=1 Tax=Aquamicrobium segne TaxID=469547 RepID=A0ABW0H453_9HYPH